MDDTDKIKAQVAAGYVRAVRHPSLPYTLYNYTSKAQFEDHWPSEVMACRGLILADNGECVARPFDRFFNWGERDRYSGGHITLVTEKVDGSLGILYRDGDRKHIATRGSFDSEQAQWATAFLNDHYEDLDRIPPEWTLLFEIVYPSNRIVVDYGEDEDLFLLAIRNRFTGEYLPFEEVRQTANWYAFPLPDVYQFNNAEEIVEACRSLDGNAEGWVAEFSDGQRFKFKGDMYLELHRLVTNTSFKRVLSWVADGVYNDMVAGVPDEFLEQVKGWKQDIEKRINIITREVEQAYHQAPKVDRKTFAMWVQKHEPALAPYLFARLDGRDYTELIYRKEF